MGQEYIYCTCQIITLHRYLSLEIAKRLLNLYCKIALEFTLYIRIYKVNFGNKYLSNKFHRGRFMVQNGYFLGQFDDVIKSKRRKTIEPTFCSNAKKLYVIAV